MFGELKLGLYRDENGAVPPPTDVAWAGDHSVDENAALGTLVGGAVTGTDPNDLELTFSLADDDGGNYDILEVEGTWRVRVIGVLDFEDDPEPTITIRATNSGGSSYDEVFAITVNDAAETPPEDPLPDGDVVVDDPANHDVVPHTVEVDGAVKIAGKKKQGGIAKFVYDIGALGPSERYIIEYAPDFSLLADEGANVLVAFTMVQGNNFHMVGLKGDGSTGVDKYKLSGTWNAQSGFTETDGGAPTNGTQAGPNFVKLETSADGSTVTFFTGTSATGPWTEEFTAYVPSPLSAADDATTFGIGAFFPATSSGPYSISITQWIETAIVFGAWSPTYRHTDMVLSGSNRTVTSNAASNSGVLGDAPMLTKTYWEYDIVDITTNNVLVGLALQSQRTNLQAPVNPSTQGCAWNSNGSAPFNNGFAEGSRLGFAYDPATGDVWAHENGTWLGSGDPTNAAFLTLTTAVGRVYTPFCAILATASVRLVTNPADFAHSIPAGFSPLEVAPWPAFSWSAVDKGANLTLSENNTKATKVSTGHHNTRIAVEACKGKQVWAIEVTADGAGATEKCVGVQPYNSGLTTIMGGGSFAVGYQSAGDVRRNTSLLQTYTAWGTVGDILMIATEYDNQGTTQKVWFGLNGTWNGDPGAGTGDVGTWVADSAANYGFIGCGATDAGDAFKLIDWPYSVPTGFTAPPVA